MPLVKRIGVLLAAGRGRRMGGTKQLKIWQSAAGPKPLICAAYDAIRPICDEMIVALGHESEVVATVLADRPFRQVIGSPDEPMFASIRTGLIAAHEIAPAATVVLQPGDHPEVAPATLQRLIQCWLQQPSVALIPECSGRGGHPVLIPPDVAAQILADGCSDGLGQFWQDRPDLCVRIAVDDPAILHDVDTPADLR